jgi:hypothetical protein
MRKLVPVFLFFGLFGCYLSLSPAEIAGMGYTGEEILSADRMLTIMDAWRKGVPPPPMVWSRHGPLPVLFDVPFVAVGKFIVSPEWVLSFEPVLVTAAIGLVLFLWLRKLTSPGMSLLLTLVAAFGTMLWPYAYIGLEPKQSLFVLFAGYLGLACGELRGWPRVLLFAAVCGIAVSLKSTGVVLFPAIAWLLYVQFGERWRSRKLEVLAALAVIGCIWVASVWTRNFFWKPMGGGFRHLRPWLIDSPVSFFGNWIGVFGSPTKGLFLFAPVLVLSLWALPKTFRTHRNAAVFVLILTAGIASQLAMLRSLADEVWGSRYMHTAIAPLMVAIGAARPRFEWLREAPLVVLGAIGTVISFLGSLYYYGVWHLAMTMAGQNTSEWLAGDSVWNQIQFNARLFRVWMQGGTAPVAWTPAHIWMYAPPPDMPAWKTLNLRPWSQPQSLLLRLWEAPKHGTALWEFAVYMAAWIIGISLLAAVVWIVIKETRSAAADGEVSDPGGREPYAVPRCS